MSTPLPEVLLDKVCEEVKYENQKLNSLLLTEMYFMAIGDKSKVTVIKEK